MVKMVIKWKRDIICAAGLTITLFIAMYFLLGFVKFGLDTPYFPYNIDDGISFLAQIKEVGTEGWSWHSGRLGAPFGANNLDFATCCLMNTELLMAKIIYIFTSNPVIVCNIMYLLAFSFCGISAFCVLRYLKVNRCFSLFGSGMFALAPYIFWRNETHFCLTACYFVPLSILLCIWVFCEQEEYLALNKRFFRYKKNILTVLFAFLIANNGIGYYAFFTCFLLCVTGLCQFCVTKKISAVKKAGIVVFLICFFFLVALIPVFLHQWNVGSNTDISKRSIIEGEIYGLKIAQLFIPTNSHNIHFIDKLINLYNSNMPLVNENRSAYLGICGIVGFLISLIFLFIPNYNKGTEEEKLYLFSRLNLGAVLFGTVGGFSSLFSLAVHFLRGYNRISIFILFISISTFMVWLQRKWNTIVSHRSVFASICMMVAVLCLWEQLPTYGASDGMLSVNKAEFQSDHDFVSTIETELQPGDMVYQMPYHQYPEAGPVKNMSDYQLFVGYVHSSTLKWSYGGTKGREGDRWNAEVASLPIDQQIDAIIKAGFRGIYIDARAYSQEELADICFYLEMILQEQALISENGNLLFYNLYPYVETYTGLTVVPYEIGKLVSFDKTKEDAHIYFVEGISGTEIYFVESNPGMENGFAWTEGTEGKLRFRLSDMKNQDLLLKINLDRIYHEPQRLVVKCDDDILFDEVLTEVRPIEIFIPSTCVREGLLELSLHYPNALSPKELGESEDGRKLAIGIASFSLNAR